MSSFFNRRVASSFFSGSTATAAVTFFTGSTAIAYCSSNNSSSSFLPSHFMKYESVAESAYAILNKDEDYNNLGQVSRDEVSMTVLPNAYTQIGVLLPDGVRELFDIKIPEGEVENTNSSPSK